MRFDPQLATYLDLDDKPVAPPQPLFRPTKHKPAPGPDDFVLADTRSRRRRAQRDHGRQVRRHQRAYVRRELGKEREANQIAHLLAIHDGLEPVSGWRMRNTVDQALLRRVKWLREVDTKRYDREWDERRAKRVKTSPRPVLSHDEAWAQLRAVAATARIVTPKVNIPRQVLWDDDAWAQLRADAATRLGKSA